MIVCVSYGGGVVGNLYSYPNHRYIILTLPSLGQDKCLTLPSLGQDKYS
ncbi:MAG: hypothetical protein HYY40_11115 [Bacteroidetes bacterium]|nr:hypothetical protein [Bacteroidota bacterium]